MPKRPLKSDDFKDYQIVNDSLEKKSIVQYYTIEFQKRSFKHCPNVENLFETSLSQNEQKSVDFFLLTWALYYQIKKKIGDLSVNLC